MMRSLLAAPQHVHRRCISSSAVDWLTSDDVPVYKNWINGQAQTSSAETFFSVTNPATNQVVAKVPQTTPKELNEAALSASNAYKDWKRVPIQQRQRIMLNFQQLIRDNSDDLANWITLENGKTTADAKGDVFRGLEVVESACMMADRLMGESLGGISSSMDCVSYRHPLGVCSGIAPFNFPAMIPLWMFPIAWYENECLQ
jgi:malonate-semialdehyde dehydrogenase (acetylating)/methylmalonate-semialdehyde dehydrogenase